VALVTIGIALIVFGGLVLLWFPDRPGGVLEFRGVRVRSAGAGLPLIVLGLVAVVLAALQGGGSAPESGAAQTTRSSSSTGQSATFSLPSSPPVQVTPASDCLTAHFDEEPKVASAFQVRLPEGETVKLQTMVDSAVLLMVNGETAGAVRLRYAGGIGTPTLTVYDVVDASCQPGTSTTEEITKGFRVTVTLPDHGYELLVTYPDHPVYPLATFHVLG